MKNYVIFNISEVDLVNFDQILETSADSLRKSKDGLKAVIKWNGSSPSFINNMTSIEGPYNETEILVIMETPLWNFTGGGGEIPA